MIRLLVAASLTVAALALPPAPAAGAASCADVFPTGFATSLRQSYPDLRITAAVYDTRTRCWYDLHRDLRLTTASAVKAGVLGAALLRGQDAGRGLTGWESAQAGPMIRLSHNPETSRLIRALGGPGALARYERRLGATETTYSSAFGATLTSARDRTLVSLRILRGGGPLAAPARGTAWRLMGSVHPTQRWGISAGVRSGYEVALKNGFYPMRGNGWRIGSTGFVRQRGSNDGYAITVLTDRGPDHATGMRAVEDVSRRVAELLTGTGPVHPRGVDRAVCTSARSGESWAQLAGRLGIPGRGADVRHVSGGNSTPLSGQRACRPELR
jgi:beta-lactamase class A